MMMMMMMMIIIIIIITIIIIFVLSNPLSPLGFPLEHLAAGFWNSLLDLMNAVASRGNGVFDF